MALVLITAPTVEPVSLAEAKAHLRVDIDDDDTLIGGLITTARTHLEGIARPKLAMISQTWEYIADTWPEGNTFELRPYPLQSITSIKYVDEDGVETTYSSVNYLVDTYSQPGRVRLKSDASWPSATLREMNGLAIRFVAGYGAAGSAVPVQLRQAILLLVGHWYENREPVLTTGMMAAPLPLTVDALFRNWRREV
jgi:uncharacterized phiE125 gp8 family phage protein